MRERERINLRVHSLDLLSKRSQVRTAALIRAVMLRWSVALEGFVVRLHVFELFIRNVVRLHVFELFIRNLVADP